MFARRISILGFVMLTMTMMGCQSLNKAQRGALAGAGVGGVVGGASKGGKGAVIGAAAGALAGGLIGGYLDRRQRELQQVVETEKTESGLKVTLKNDVLFDFNKNDLKEPAKQTLTELAAILAKYPKDNLRISGYTDHIGEAAYNKRLSAIRAEEVRRYLADAGVKNRMNAVGMGEIPGEGTNPDLVAANRKVEIFIDVEPPPQASVNP